MRALLFCCCLLVLIPQLGYAQAKLGKPAPEIIADDTHGHTFVLSQLYDTPIILEWTNFSSPYVKKHYQTKNMQSLQHEFAERGAIWITVMSSGPASKSYLNAEQANIVVNKLGAVPAHILIDETGEIGKTYGATRTPEVFIIDREGDLVYSGAIDNDPSLNSKNVKNATNYIKLTFYSMRNNTLFQNNSIKPYGTPIPYQK